MRFIQHRVADKRIHRLIQKWLKAGVSEDGEWSETKVGTPQGAVVSPLLAKRVPTLRIRSMAGGMAEKGGEGQSDGHSLRGRSGAGVGAPRRGRAVPERVWGTAGEGRTGTAPPEDAEDGVRTKRRKGAPGAGGRENGERQ